MTKICSSCKIEKEDNSFNKKYEGLSAYCKECNKLFLKKHYEKNKEYYITKSRNRKNLIIKIINEFKEKTPCKDCGNLYSACVMDFDHLHEKKF